jgi:hypothetical protein
MKTLSFALMLVSGLTNGQSCSVHQPLTDTQKAMVSGRWVGHYELGGIRRDFSVQVDFKSGTEAVTITNPPVEDKITDENLRFCPSGAFHFRKVIADGHFEFDGVPGAKEMKGSLVVVIKGGKKSGEFALQRAE